LTTAAGRKASSNNMKLLLFLVQEEQLKLRRMHAVPFFVFTLTIAASAALFIFCVAFPVRSAQRARAHRQWNEDYRWVKLRAIKRHYPALGKLPDEVVFRRYDLDSWYDSIGR
jgi:hypothetical protein